MKLRTILAGTAIATLALVTDAGAPLGVPMMAKAEAAVSVSLSLFYDDLGQHGDWVRYHDAYVFIPRNVDADWRPYTLGHWVYTKRYGWTWVSEEPFGWATYHYGRWGYAEDIGWYWVPGTRWAPAWVSWRRSNDYIVWAPLPPTHRTGVSVSVRVRDIPEFYWVAVPSREFLAPDIRVVVIHEDREIRRVVEHTEYVGAPKVTNNIVINNVIDVNVVQKVTGKEVPTVEVNETTDPRQAKATADQVTVFKGELATDKKAKPKDVTDVKEVKKVKRGGAADTTTTTTPEPDATTGTTTDTGKTTDEQKKKPKAETNTNATTGTGAAEQNTPVEVPQPDATNKPADAGDKGKGKGKVKVEEPAQSGATEEPPSTTPPAEAPTDQGKKKKKPDQPEQAQPDQAQQPSDNGATATTPEPKGNDNGKAKGKDKKECDPATDANCPPAQ